MKRIICIICLILILPITLGGCTNTDEPIKIGVSLGVGFASRWDFESHYMQERAQALGTDIEIKLNHIGDVQTQQQDCFDLIDGGIDVLVLTPHNAQTAEAILAYAHRKNVPVVNYARLILGQDVDLFVGYDSERNGQQIGLYLSESVHKGNYIILHGDEGDHNANLLYTGAMRYIAPIKDNINLLLDASVPNWDPLLAKQLVRECLQQNNHQIDAILAPNDKIAEACREVLTELGIETPVAISGMDAELSALQRIASGTQSMTVYVDLQKLANTAIDEACHLAKGEAVTTNAELDNRNGGTIAANLLAGEIVTKENLDRLLIDSGRYTYDDIYGETPIVSE